jgi:hypothetical protein
MIVWVCLFINVDVMRTVGTTRKEERRDKALLIAKLKKDAIISLVVIIHI